MSSGGKLDQSLDEILSSQRRAAKGRPAARRTSARRAATATAAPAGGIQKNKPARNATKPAPAKGAGVSGESKIMVSNLPKDVSEAQIKEYFKGSVGQVKRVDISYGPGGVSRGVAHVTFPHADGASQAFKALSGVHIDNRPIKVEVLVSNADLIPQPKTLGQRITQQAKAQPKSAANVKAGAKAAAAGKNAKKPVRGRGGRNNRPSKKTAEELDSEMADYFNDANNENANGAAPAAANGDAPMEDEVL